MHVHNSKQYASFRGDDGERVTLRPVYSPVIPHHKGIEISLECSGDYFGAYLIEDEVQNLADFLSTKYGDPDVKSLSFTGENGEQLVLLHTNMGEPYREGVEFDVRGVGDFPSYMSPFVESFEIRRMRDFVANYLKEA